MQARIAIGVRVRVLHGAVVLREPSAIIEGTHLFRIKAATGGRPYLGRHGRGRPPCLPSAPVLPVSVLPAKTLTRILTIFLRFARSVPDFVHRRTKSRGMVESDA